MAKQFVLALFIGLGACAMPNGLQRIGVDHNAAAADIADELTLLNILRAREGFPLHYTQINRLTGNINVRGSIGINDAIRGPASTVTNRSAETSSATPSAVTEITRQVASGVDVITPNVGAEVTLNPSLDVIVLDNQRFYQGITAAIPFTTVQNLLSQNPDQRLLLMMLLIERIDFRDAVDGSPTKGQIVFSWMNQDVGQMTAFSNIIDCYNLTAQTEARAAVRLSPVSRLPRGPNGELVGLRLEDLSLLNGTGLELSEPLGASSSRDNEIFVQRPRPDRGGANLSRIVTPNCPVVDLTLPPSDPVYLSDNLALMLVQKPDEPPSSERRAVEPEITFRSAEGVIRYVGRYLHAVQESPTRVHLVNAIGLGPWTSPQNGLPLGRFGPIPQIGTAPLFSVVRGQPPGSVVTATILDQRYSVASDVPAERRRNMQVIGIIQQLINLHKDSTERPVTVPVRVLGGG